MVSCLELVASVKLAKATLLRSELGVTDGGEKQWTGVEVEVEGERWVTDLHYEDLDDVREKEFSVRSGKSGKERSRLKKRSVGGVGSDSEREVLRRAWEKGRPSRKGEWRRRRWVRGVERVPVNISTE